MLPGMDGYEACRLMRKHPQLAEVPIIMITALDDRDSKLTGLLAGADTFLIKPFDTVELQIRLRTILQINRYRRLLAERARFAWIVEHAEDGYLLLDQFGCIQFANAKAQVFLHLPAEYTGMDFFTHVEKTYTPHPSEKWASWLTAPSVLYFVQAETQHSSSFWLLVDAVDIPDRHDNSRVVRLSDVTEKMNNKLPSRR